MDLKEKIQSYVNSQQSLHLYSNVKEAFVDVFGTLSENEFDEITHNLILMVLHEGAVAQVMHFEPMSEKFKILQLTIPHDISSEALRWVIAHELGHVMQGRNWQENDGLSLEDDATEWSKQRGFQETDEIKKYLEGYKKRFDST